MLPVVNVLGVPIHPLRRAELIPTVLELLGRGGKTTVTYANVHVLNLAQQQPSLKAFLGAADLCYCDGNGVRLGAKLLGHELPERMTGADWIWDLAREAEGRLRLYWLGGKPGVAAKAAQVLRTRHPRLEIETDHGYRPRTGPKDDACVERINSFRSDIVLVGMGTPQQELWVEARRARIDASIVWCLGATADFIAGEVPRGPLWLAHRAEWLCRLATEPRRLWRRYLLGNTLFLGRVLWERHRTGLTRRDR